MHKKISLSAFYPKQIEKQSPNHQLLLSFKTTNQLRNSIDNLKSKKINESSIIAKIKSMENAKEIVRQARLEK